MNDIVVNPFAGKSSEVVETAGAKQGQQREMAETQAMVVMAKKFPRDQVVATDRILNAFTRSSLAEDAQYQFSRGGADIVGPSIRAAEAIAQQWGNMSFGFRELSRGVAADGVGFSEVEAFCWDMENNSRRPAQFIVRHWRDTRSGGYKLKDERDIYELTANQAQRRVRACILALVPGDVTEAAMAQAAVTLKSTADTSPEAMKKMVSTFHDTFGITKEMIEKRIQRRIDAIQPAQVVSLKRIYVSLRDGMSAPEDWFEGAGAPPPSSGIDETKAAIKAAAEKAAADKASAKPMTVAEFHDELNKLQTPDSVVKHGALIENFEAKYHPELVKATDAKLKEVQKQAK
jgi:hypothetical protein